MVHWAACMKQCAVGQSSECICWLSEMYWTALSSLSSSSSQFTLIGLQTQSQKFKFITESLCRRFEQRSRMLPRLCLQPYSALVIGWIRDEGLRCSVAVSETHRNSLRKGTKNLQCSVDISVVEGDMVQGRRARMNDAQTDTLFPSSFLFSPFQYVLWVRSSRRAEQHHQCAESKKGTTNDISCFK